MKTRKPKPPSNAEIYNAILVLIGDVTTMQRHMLEFFKRQSELERRVAILERTKEPKHYGRESE